MADSNITQTSTTSTIPDWAQGYFTGEQGIFPQAQALAQQGYQSYAGDRQAGMSGLTQQAIQGAGAMTPSTLTNLGGGIAGSAALNAGNMNYQGYQPGQFDSAQANQYMNPFMQNVVDIQQREAQRQADIAGTSRNAGAVKAGAFGGSRQGVMDAEAARNLAIQKGDIQAQGLNQAYNQAQGQFNTEQQLAEQSSQYGAGLGLQGLQTAIQGAGQLGNLGNQGFTQGMDINKLQAQYGNQQQGIEQTKLDQQYQDFLTQQQYPYKQLGFYTDILGSGLRGASGVTSQATNMYAPPPSTTSQLIGLGTAGLGAYNAFSGKAKGGTVGYAGGGSIGGYAVGGIAGLNPMELDAATDKMSDPQMQGVMGLASVADLAKLQIAQKLAQNNQIRQAAQQAQAAQQQQPQGSIAEEALAELGVGGLDVPDEMFSGAGGGIVAFAEGGPSWIDDQNEEMRRNTPMGRALGHDTLDDIIEFFTANDAKKRIKAREAKAKAEAGADAEPVTARDQRTEGGGAGRGQYGGYSTEADAAYKGEAQARAAEEERIKIAARDVTGTSRSLGGAPTGSDYAGLRSLVGQYANLGDEPMKAAEGATKTAGDAAIKANEGFVAQMRRDQTAMGERGVEEEEALKGSQKDMKGAEDKNLNMALIEAGLAMMAGNSANAFENIGKGASVGLKGYKEGSDKIQVKKDKLQESLNRLNDARFSDKKDNAKEVRGAEKDVMAAKIALGKDLANVKVEGAKLGAANARAAIDAQVKISTQQIEDKNAMARTIAAIPALSAEANELLKQGNRIAGMDAGPEKDAAEEALDKRRARLEKAAQAQYPGGASVEQRANTALDKAVQEDLAVQNAGLAMLGKTPKSPGYKEALDNYNAALKDARVRLAPKSSSVNSGAATLPPGFNRDK